MPTLSSSPRRHIAALNRASAGSGNVALTPIRTVCQECVALRCKDTGNRVLPPLI